MQKNSLLIDVTRVLRRRAQGRLPTGIDRVIEAYVSRYAAARLVLNVAGHAAPMSARDSDRVRGWLADGRVSPWSARALAARVAFGAWQSTDAAGSLLLNLGHQGLDHGYARGLRRAGARLVTFLHDVIPLTHGEYCRPGEARRHARRVRHAMVASRGLIVNSHATFDALHRVAAEEGWTQPRTVVAPLAPAIREAAPVAVDVPKPYFVMLGTIEPRKNHGLVLQMWRRLSETMGEACPRLVLVGQRGWECENAIDLLERCRELRGTVVERSGCSDDELGSLLAGARALLFPSFAEGFGLPLVEALSRRVPVIASDLAVFREIAGDVPEYADPLDGARWMSLVRDYAREDSALRQAQLARIPTLRLPTWEAHFELVDEFLAQCAAVPQWSAARTVPLRRPVPVAP